MSALEASSLLEAAHNGDNEACERMLEENNGLIWSVVRAVLRPWGGAGRPVPAGLPGFFKGGAGL